MHSLSITYQKRYDMQQHTYLSYFLLQYIEKGFQRILFLWVSPNNYSLIKY